MKVQTKISLLLIVLSIVFIGGITEMELMNRRRIRQFFHSKIQDKMAFFERVLQLDGASLHMFAFEFSCRSELLRYMEKGGSESIHSLLSDAFSAFNADAAWIYTPRFSLRRTYGSLSGAPPPELPVSERSFKRLFMRRSYFQHFFISSAQGLLEIRTAPIQEKALRGTTRLPKGFLFVGRLWSEPYVQGLSLITESTIRLKPLTDPLALHHRYDPDRHTITFTKLLKGWDKAPCMQLAVTYKSPFMLHIKRTTRLQFFIILLFVMSILGFLTLALYRWVHKPLRMLSQTMRTEDPSTLAGTVNQQTEFGTFADLLNTFFQQKQELEKNNVRLREHEQKLKATNQQLLAQEQELRAANQQLEAGNRQLKDSEAALRISEERYRQLVETMNDGIVVVNQAGYITYCNERFCLMMQHPPDAVMHRPVAELLSPESRAFLADDVLNKENVAGRLQGDYQTYELVWQKSTGEPLPTMVSPQPIYENDAIAGSFAVITDITDIKKAEKEIRDYKEFLESVIDGSHDAIMITDSSGIILSANKALTMMLGLSKEEIVGSPPSAVFDPSCRKSVYNAVHEGFGIGYALFEAAHTKQDGTRVETENNFALIKDENGALIGGVVIMRDITERKKMQQKLLQSEKMRSLGQLAGGVAHDFNNVLTAIIGRVQLLLKALDGSTGRTSPNHNREKIREDMRVIEKAAIDGAETVRRIQQFSRRRDDEDYFSNADCNEIVKDAIAFTSVRWKGEAESQGITIRVQEDLAPLPAVACRVSELREVIINILNNAFDAMPEGGAVTVQTRSHKGRVFLDISDTGTGIPPEAQPRIFEPFFTTKGLRSTGLGMSISYGIIERHRGALSVHETSPSGTTFRIELPASGKSDRPGTARNTAAYLPAGIRVLVIEDEKHIRDLLCEILEELGCAVTPAADGTKGMECFEAGTYDLVLTDLAMPGLTGFQVAQLIRKSSTPSIPIVLVTGWGTTIQESELHEYGISCTINKPFEIDQIHRVLGRILQQ